MSMKLKCLGLLFIGSVYLNLSCNKVESCNSTSKEAFQIFKAAAEKKDYKTLKGITSDFLLKFANYEELFGMLAEPSVVLIDGQVDGTYGIKKMGDYEIYYFSLMDGQKFIDKKVVTFRLHGNCFKITNLSQADRSLVQGNGTVNSDITSDLTTPKNEDSQVFLKRNLKIMKSLHAEKKCNFLQKHFLIVGHTDNDDSLSLAIEVLTDSLWQSIPMSDQCVKNVRCGVYLYRSPKDFEVNGLRNWFAMGSKITGEQVKVRIN